MIELTPTGAGTLIPVHAQPGARRNGVIGVHDGRLKVAVTQVPEGGKANQKIRQVIADSLGVKRSQVTLETGAQSSRKTFLVNGLMEADLRKRIDLCLKSLS